MYKLPSESDGDDLDGTHQGNNENEALTIHVSRLQLTETNGELVSQSNNTLYSTPVDDVAAIRQLSSPRSSIDERDLCYPEILTPSSPELSSQQSRDGWYVSASTSKRSGSLPVTTHPTYTQSSEPDISIGPHLPRLFKDVPLHIRYECIRGAGANHSILEQITKEDLKHFHDHENLQQWFNMHTTGSHAVMSSVRADIWNEASRSFDNITMAASAVVTFVDGQACFTDVCWDPLTLDRSHLLGRAFGGHRFLSLRLRLAADAESSFSTRGQSDNVLSLWETAVSSLGCEWQVVRLRREASLFRIDLFATHIFGPSPVVKEVPAKPSSLFFLRSRIPVADVWNWFISFEHNPDLTLVRAYKRLDLGFSRTWPTISFRPSQFRRVGDMYANGEPEATEYNDPALAFDHIFDEDNPEIMNDGCARISLAAARLIVEKLELDFMPSAFQARIGCYKGVWVVEKEHDPHDLWIEVTPSQQKFQPHFLDLEDVSYDPRRTTFAVVRYSKRLYPARMSHTLLPILVDRGVDESQIQLLYRNSLQYEESKFFEVFDNPAQLYSWVQSRWNDDDEDESEYLGSLPRSLKKLAMFLLEHGFEPQNDPYLADKVIRLAMKSFVSLKSALKLRLARSVYTVGVADLWGLLPPGCIFLAFSTPFVDDQRNLSYTSLNNIDVLIGRFPALRPSDIQKVRAVYHPGLTHLQDVVVFPARGTIPLAGKMSNGDYDGDDFWVCWEPDLVRTFQNAPHPQSLPTPDEVGMSVVTGTLGELKAWPTRAERTVQFQRVNHHFRAHDDLKGHVSNCFDAYVYALGSLHSVSARYLADVHDLLMDSEKSGSYLSYGSFHDKLRRLGLNTKTMPEPLYKSKLKGKATTVLGDSHPPARNVTDRIIVEVLNPFFMSIEQRFGHKHSSVEQADDSALREPFESYKRGTKCRTPTTHLIDSLQTNIEHFHKKWNNIWSSREGRSATSKENSFQKTQCLHDAFWSCDVDDIDDGCFQNRGVGRNRPPTERDLLKASMIWHRYGSTAFTYMMAGSVLAHLKAWGGHVQPRTIVPAIYGQLVVRRPRRYEARDGTNDEREND